PSVRVPSACVPTAHTSLVATAETPDSWLSPGPFGLETTVHELPFQCCVSVTPSGLVAPTAQTSFVSIAVAARNSPEPLVGTVVHEEPFQWMASGLYVLSVLVEPTAHTSSGATAATEVRSLFWREPFGVGTTAHADPFQCSARVRSEEPSKNRPTAQASPGLIAATPARKLSDAPEFGLGTMCHAVPSKCWVSVR